MLYLCSDLLRCQHTRLVWLEVSQHGLGDVGQRSISAWYSHVVLFCVRNNFQLPTRCIYKSTSKCMLQSQFRLLNIEILGMHYSTIKWTSLYVLNVHCNRVRTHYTLKSLRQNLNLLAAERWALDCSRWCSDVLTVVVSLSFLLPVDGLLNPSSPKTFCPSRHDRVVIS